MSGYVVLVDIDGYTRMKIDEKEEDYIALLADFFTACEENIHDMGSHDGGGYIIGDGALFFFKCDDKMRAKDIIANDITARLLRKFHSSIEENNIENSYKLSISAGYCDFFVRRGSDLVGPDIDKLFSLIKSAEDEAILLNDRLLEMFEAM